MDGALKRNNPINELVRGASRIRAWHGRKIGCIVSLGTGWTDPSEVPARLKEFLRQCVELATSLDDIVD